jgi:hypothetical protein
MPFGIGFWANTVSAAPATAGSYELIETISVGSGGVASVTFSGLSAYSSTYRHLQIRAVARGAGSGASDYIGIRLNGDTGANYSWHQIFGNGSAVGSGAATSVTRGLVSEIAGSSQTANSFGVGVIDLLDVYSTTKNKTMRGLSGNPTTALNLWSSAWYNTAAVSSITLLEYDGAGNFAQFSRFSLYGIKG